MDPLGGERGGLWSISVFFCGLPSVFLGGVISLRFFLGSSPFGFFWGHLPSVFFLGHLPSFFWEGISPRFFEEVISPRSFLGREGTSLPRFFSWSSLLGGVFLVFSTRRCFFLVFLSFHPSEVFFWGERRGLPLVFPLPFVFPPRFFCLLPSVFLSSLLVFFGWSSLLFFFGRRGLSPLEFVSWEGSFPPRVWVSSPIGFWGLLPSGLFFSSKKILSIGFLFQKGILPSFFFFFCKKSSLPRFFFFFFF